jgi:hypothetical protein
VKKLKSVLGLKVESPHYRTFKWYKEQIETAGARLVDYNSFSIFPTEKMPKWIVHYFQKVELSKYKNGLLASQYLRRHGAELKLKARVCKA